MAVEINLTPEEIDEAVIEYMERKYGLPVYRTSLHIQVDWDQYIVGATAEVDKTKITA